MLNDVPIMYKISDVEGVVNFKIFIGKEFLLSRNFGNKVAHPLNLLYLTKRFIKWTTDISFNKGVYVDTEVSGEGESCIVALKENIDNDDNILYNDDAKYTLSDGGKITVDEGDNNRAKLKMLSGEGRDWSFTTPANYTYDDTKIGVIGGVAKLQKGIPANLEGYFKFEDNVVDSSGNNRHGTNQGATFVNGKVERAIEVNGSSGYVNISNSNFIFNDVITVEAWIKLDKVTGCQGICTSSSEKAQPKWLFQVNTGKLRLYVPNAYYTANTLLSVGTWYFVVFSGTLAGGGKFYLNGVDDGNIGSWSAGTGGGAQCDVGKSGGSNFLDGMVDEVAIYHRALGQAEIQDHYNAGAGKHLDPDVTSDPKIYPDTGLPFLSPLNMFTETSTKPAGTEIKHQVSSDNGATWKWWNGVNWVARTGGQTDTWYYANECNLAGIINTNIGDLANAGTFKPNSYLHSNDGSATPELDNIYTQAPIIYSTDDNLYIDTKDTSQIAPTTVLAWLSALFTYNKPAGTDIRIMLSNNGRTSWQYYNGFSWDNVIDATNRISGNTISEVEDNFSSFPKGNGTLDIRLFLYTSVSALSPDIDNINVTSDYGYLLSGEYESNIYNSNYLSLDWKKVIFDVNIPNGTTLHIKARCSNSSSIMGNYGSNLSNNSETHLNGRYLQWKAEFIGNGNSSSELNSIGFNFETPLTSEIQP